MSTNQFNRQYALHIVVDLTIANIGAGNEVTAALPQGALLLGIDYLTVTAFNGTTNTGTVGDGTTTFVSAVDVKTTGAETVTNAPKFYPTGGTLTFSLAQTGVATVGRVVAVARYVQLGVGGCIQG